MRQQLQAHQSPPLQFDAEGFPMAVLSTFTSPLDRRQDNESGEWVQDRVIVLRHSQHHHHQLISAHPPQLRLLHVPWPLVQRAQNFPGFQSRVVPGFGDGLQFPYKFNLPRKHHSDTHGSPIHKPDDLVGLRPRPIFKVPPELLQGWSGEASSSAKGHNKIIYISIWQEFIYGPSVWMMERHRLTSQEIHSLRPLTSSLSQFLNINIVYVFLYLFFFGVYFLSCCMFHDLLELGFYLLYMNHLSIHLLANSSDIDVTFSGSLFQGPAYALIRFCCQHCTQKNNATVMWRHMAKMKHDIVKAKVT